MNENFSEKVFFFLAARDFLVGWRESNEHASYGLACCVRSQGACFAYLWLFPRPMNNLSVQSTLLDTSFANDLRSSSRLARTHRSVTIARVISPQVFAFRFPVDFISQRYQHRKCWMSWQVNDLFICIYVRFGSHGLRKVLPMAWVSSRNVKMSNRKDRQSNEWERKKIAKSVVWAETAELTETSSPRRCRRCCNIVDRNVDRNSFCQLRLGTISTQLMHDPTRPETSMLLVKVILGE